jgi:hypothetical protein
MRLTTVTVFGLGYVLGSRAGRGGYEKACELAQGAAERFVTSGARQRLAGYAARLDAYSARSGPRRTPTE